MCSGKASLPMLQIEMMDLVGADEMSDAAEAFDLLEQALRWLDRRPDPKITVVKSNDHGARRMGETVKAHHLAFREPDRITDLFKSHPRMHTRPRQMQHSISIVFAVGTVISHRPPRRSRRALLTHRAPTSGRTSNAERFGRAQRPAHIRHSGRRSSPAQCPDCGRLTAVSLGPGPSLHALGWKLPSIVWSLFRYYGPGRLFTRVHLQRTAFGLPEPAPTEVGISLIAVACC